MASAFLLAAIRIKMAHHQADDISIPSSFVRRMNNWRDFFNSAAHCRTPPSGYDVHLGKIRPLSNLPRKFPSEVRSVSGDPAFDCCSENWHGSHVRRFRQSLDGGSFVVRWRTSFSSRGFDQM